MTIDAVHPGVIRTRLGDPGGPLGLVLRAVKRKWAPVEAGAAPIVRLVDQRGTGRYFDIDREVSVESDVDLVERLWRQAEDLTRDR